MEILEANLPEDPVCRARGTGNLKRYLQYSVEQKHVILLYLNRKKTVNRIVPLSILFSLKEVLEYEKDPSFQRLVLQRNMGERG